MLPADADKALEEQEESRIGGRIAPAAESQICDSGPGHFGGGNSGSTGKIEGRQKIRHKKDTLKFSGSGGIGGGDNR